jgi:hypothetical protein
MVLVNTLRLLLEIAMLSAPRWALMILVASLASACAHVEEPREKSADKAPTLSKQRQILSEGYSILYRDAGNLDLSELILYVKAESDAMKEVVTAISRMGGELKKDLEQIAKDYPGVRIDLDPLPEMEKRKRAAVGKDRAKEFAPVVGKGGREYERTVLLSFANGLNHERHLCQVMAEAEPDAGLKKFLLETGKKYDGLYDRVIALLEKEYFKIP